jgi:hypothetical protein
MAASTRLGGALTGPGRALTGPGGALTGPGVALTAVPAPPGSAAARLRLVAGGAVPPVRFSLYLDGDLVDAAEAQGAVAELTVPRAGDGRHIVTVRAVDARGRWGGLSRTLELRAS